jgi:ABC-type Mn2+/Zn2+ transport system ATPase subunit
LIKIQELRAGEQEEKLQLLKGANGAFRPGVLTALMGVTGAGKTTLMDVLAGRKTGGYIEGSITISGYPKKQEKFARISGYCEQNESLKYSAWLRLPKEIDSKAKDVSLNSCSMYRKTPSSMDKHKYVLCAITIFLWGSLD